MSHQLIPNIFHLIYFGGRDFHLINYLTIKSIVTINRPDKIYFYTDQNMSGDYWDKASKYVEVVPYSAPTTVHGQQIIHPAHKSDIARLSLLYEHGGIYLDLDVICRRPFDDLLTHQVVLGKEVVEGKQVGICSAVSLAQPTSMFSERWLDGFNPDISLWRGFRSKGFDKYYSEMTTKYGNFLATIYPEEVHVEPYESFFNPSYDEESLNSFFNDSREEYDRAYCHHLWANATWDSYLSHISEELIKDSNSSFSQLARQFLD